MIIFTRPDTSGSVDVGPDFMAQMEAHKGDPVEVCEFVPCDFRRIDYAHMSEKQIRYYVYWRDQLRKGKLEKPDKGYVFLRICELANIPEDESSASAQMKLLSYRDGNAFSPDELAELRFDMSVAQNARLGTEMPYETVREAACRGM